MDDLITEKVLKYVSRETCDNFIKYKELVEEWNRNTQLVQKETLKNFMERHILDSLQLLSFIHLGYPTIDIGTGAGFPGMVLAMSGVANITLCDSNARKIVFLNEVKRCLAVDVRIILSRVEDIVDNKYQQVITRACAELGTLIEYSLSVSRETENPVTLIALKGKMNEMEINKAKERFTFNCEKINSVTSSNGVILKITNIRKI